MANADDLHNRSEPPRLRGVLSVVRLLKPVPVPAAVAPPLPDPDSPALPEAGSFDARVRLRVRAADAHAALGGAARVLLEGDRRKREGPEGRVQLRDVHGGGSLRGFHLRSRRLRLPAAAEG